MLFTALLLGFTGSLHCIGMCSPLAMAVANVSKQAWLNRLFYNTGRIMTYSILGLAAASTNALVPVLAYQNLISILLGVVFVMMGVAGIGGLKIPFLTPVMVQFILLLKKIFAHILKQKNTGAVFLLGMVNGFLPCGLTFMALMVCLTLNGPAEGFLYMLLFGMGTLPAMVGFAGLIHPVMKRFQWSMKNITTVLLITSGCLLIARAFITSSSHTGMHEQKEVTIVICN